MRKRRRSSFRLPSSFPASATAGASMVALLMMILVGIGGALVAVPGENTARAAAVRTEELRALDHRISTLVLGDSLTARFARDAAVADRQHVAARGIVMSGIDGDRIANLAWRMDQDDGALLRLAWDRGADTIVIHIGTNDLSFISAEQMMDGIVALVDRVVASLPPAAHGTTPPPDDDGTTFPLRRAPRIILLPLAPRNFTRISQTAGAEARATFNQLLWRHYGGLPPPPRLSGGHSHPDEWHPSPVARTVRVGARSATVIVPPAPSIWHKFHAEHLPSTPAAAMFVDHVHWSEAGYHAFTQALVNLLDATVPDQPPASMVLSRPSLSSLPSSSSSLSSAVTAGADGASSPPALAAATSAPGAATSHMTVESFLWAAQMRADASVHHQASLLGDDSDVHLMPYNVTDVYRGRWSVHRHPPANAAAAAAAATRSSPGTSSLRSRNNATGSRSNNVTAESAQLDEALAPSDAALAEWDFAHDHGRMMVPRLINMRARGSRGRTVVNGSVPWTWSVIRGELFFQDGMWLGEGARRYALAGVYLARIGCAVVAMYPAQEVLDDEYRFSDGETRFPPVRPDHQRPDMSVDEALALARTPWRLFEDSRAAPLTPLFNQSVVPVAALCWTPHVWGLDEALSSRRVIFGEHQPRLDAVGVMAEGEPGSAVVVRIDALHSLDPGGVYRQVAVYVTLVVAGGVLHLWMMAAQLDHAHHSATLLARISVPGVVMSAVMDAYTSMGHLSAALLVDGLFAAMIFVAFVFAVAFGVLELRMLMMVWRAQNPDPARRGDFFALWIRFYVLMVLGLMLLRPMSTVFSVFMALAYSFWVPQIVANVVRDCPSPLLTRHVLATSLSRAIIPVYFYVWPRNFLGAEPRPRFGLLLVAWLALQVVVLLAQKRW